MDGFQGCECMRSTSENLTHPNTPAEWIASQAASLARIFQPLEKDQELPVSGQDSGQNLPASFGWYDPDSHSLKTAQCSLFEDSMLSLRTLPRSGSMRNGMLYPRPKLEPRISESESGLWPTIRSTDGERGGRGDLIQAVRGNPNSHYRLWPTPQAHKTTESGEIVNADGTPWDGLGKPHSKTTGRPITTALADVVAMWPTPIATDWKDGCGKTGDRAPEKAAKAGLKLGEAVKMWPTPCTRDHKGESGKGRQERRGNPQATLCNAVEKAGGSLNPTWVEWLMGWPLGYTVSKHWATAKSRSKLP